MLSLAIFAGTVVFLTLMTAALLHFGARWRAVPRAGFGRSLVLAVLAVACLLGIHTLAIQFRRPFISQLNDWSSWTYFQVAGALLFLGELLCWVILCWGLTVLLLRISLRQAFMVWLPAAIVGLGVAITIRCCGSYVIEPMQVSYGSMCPTLLNRSQVADCPECGGVAYTPWVTDRRGADSLWGRLCICSECRHSFYRFGLPQDITEPDSFVVNKLLTPRRWDMVLYRATDLPKPKGRAHMRIVRRIIGLPGEEVVIKEGGVWINGERHEPPGEIAGLQFFDRFEGVLPIAWGSAWRSARLGEDEYFVVGDFSYRSNDSRVWLQGVQGRQPFALPASHIEGVVDLRYAPFARLRVLR